MLLPLLRNLSLPVESGRLIFGSLIIVSKLRCLHLQETRLSGLGLQLIHAVSDNEQVKLNAASRSVQYRSEALWAKFESNWKFFGKFPNQYYFRIQDIFLPIP